MESKYTAKQRVLIALMQNGEMAMHELTHPSIGGVRAHARIDELRKDGIEIKYRHKEIDGKKTNTTLYYLKRRPSDWSLKLVFPKGR